MWCFDGYLGKVTGAALPWVRLQQVQEQISPTSLCYASVFTEVKATAAARYVLPSVTSLCCASVFTWVKLQIHVCGQAVVNGVCFRMQ